MRFFAATVTFTLLLTGCQTDPLDVNVRGIEVDPTFKRLDQDLFALNPAAGRTQTDSLYEVYGDFLVDYCERVLRIGHPESTSFPYAVAQFITDESMLTLHADIQEAYEDMSLIEADLTDAFTYFKYHFPDSTVPDVIFNISALNFAIVATPKALGIGLDMFLGSDYPVYPMVGLPRYMYANMKRDQLVPQAMKGWLQSMFESTADRNTLLDHMVFEGKLLYALDALLRKKPDSVKIGFRVAEIQWCKEHEGRVWAHLVDQELLYTTEHMAINKWINQAPFVAGIPKESPGRLGQWVGWQIVRRYMAEHPELSLSELMKNRRSQDILTASRYKPRH